MSPSCEVAAPDCVRFLICYRKNHCGAVLNCTQKAFGKGQNTVVLRIISKNRICLIKEVGEGFLGKNTSKCLVVLNSSLWHFWQTRKKLNLARGKFQVVDHIAWKSWGVSACISEVLHSGERSFTLHGSVSQELLPCVTNSGVFRILMPNVFYQVRKFLPIRR